MSFVRPSVVCSRLWYVLDRQLSAGLAYMAEVAYATGPAL